jgi:small-conductance mechanosensitive channel
MNQASFPHSLYQLLDIELYVVLGILCFLTFLFYKSFLKRASQVRHQNIQNHLKGINRHFFAVTVLFATYMLSKDFIATSLFFKKVTPYLATVTFIMGVQLFVRVCRLNVLMYLFIGSMTAGVPLLLVNIFSLLLSVTIALWSISHLFNVQLTPFLATSAAVSVILGLALQDTLGNLFAGISLQIDKTFEIGDWLEIQNGSSKIIGQVKELTWRATVLSGLSDEIITVPNKVVALSQISNYSPVGIPIMRSQIFRLAHNADFQKAKDLLERAVSQIADVRAIPSPLAYVSELNENWIAVKVVYFIDSYGSQFLIGDKVFAFGKSTLELNGLKLAHQILEIKNPEAKS